MQVEEGKCIIPGGAGCQRAYMNDDVQTCIDTAICMDGLKLDEDSDYLCVEECDEYYEEDDDTGELRCVDECSHWWYMPNDDGLCKEEVWRKNTAIIVPVVVVVVAIVVVVVILLLKKKNNHHVNREVLQTYS